MTRVSKNLLSPSVEKKIKNIFLDELVKITNKYHMASFFGNLLTDSEKIMLAKRLVAFVLIDQNVPDHHISESLHLTRETVARFRLTYWRAKDKNEPVATIVRKIQHRVEFKKLLKEILTGYIIPAAFGKTPKRGLL